MTQSPVGQPHQFWIAAPPMMLGFESYQITPPTKTVSGTIYGGAAEVLVIACSKAKSRELGIGVINYSGFNLNLNKAADTQSFHAVSETVGRVSEELSLCLSI
ncbi:MAG: hypothetical protein ABTQ34_06665 [Bdellovibrionales bacterium]